MTENLTSSIRGAWDADTTYQLGVVVWHSGQAWASTITNNLNSEPTGINTDWLQLSSSGGGLPTGLTYVTPCLTIGADTDNQAVVCGSATGDSVTLSAAGSDSDISVKVRGKGLGFLQLGPDTYGPTYETGTEFYQLEATTDTAIGHYIEMYSADIDQAQTTGVEIHVGTQEGGAATQDLSYLYAGNYNATSFLPAGRTLTHLWASASFAAAAGAGTVTEMVSSLAEIVLTGTAHVDSAYNFWATSAQFGAATIDNYFAFYANDPGASGINATNSYGFWLDSPGVFRIKGDGVLGYYNPGFTKYTPGAANFERAVIQWNTNVAEIGTEKGGTGTLRALKLIGASVSTVGDFTSGGAATVTTRTGTPATAATFDSGGKLVEQAGFSGPITAADLATKTITVLNGIITAFA